MAIKLTTEDRKLLADTLKFAFDDSRMAGSAHSDNVKLWRDQYEGFLSPKPKDWQSNINIPMTQTDIDNVAISIATAALGSEPYFEVESLCPDCDDQATQIEQFMQLWNDKLRFKSKLGMAIREALQTGEVWLRSGIKSTGKHIDDNRYLDDQPLNIDELDMSPEVSVVVYEDMMLLPFDTPSFKQADGAFRRVKLRWADVLKGVKAGVIDKDDAETLKSYYQVTPNNSEINEQRGIEPTVARSEWQARFECWEGVYRWAKPDTDEEIEWLILFYYPMDSNGAGNGNPLILSITEYEPIFGKNWFFQPVFVDKQPNTMHGNSMCRRLEGLQQLLNANVNQTVDAITMLIMPPIAVGNGLGTPKKLNWEPMEQWAVSATDVQVLSGGASQATAIAQAGNQSEFIRNWAERVTGNTDNAMGKTNDTKTTAFEVSASIESGSKKFNWLVGIVQTGTNEDEGIEGYAEFMLELFRKFMPMKPVQYRSCNAGAEPFSVIDGKAHQGSYQFRSHGNSAANNPQMRMQRAQMVVQSLDTCVFNQFSALDEDETIIKKCKQIYKAWNELLQAGGNKHPEQYIGGEPNTIEECMAIVSIKAPQVAGAIMQRQQQSQGMGENPALQEMGNTPEGSNGGIGGGAGAGINAPGINIPQPA